MDHEWTIKESIMTSNIIIRLEQVTKQYDHDQMVLDHVSFEI